MADDALPSELRTRWPAMTEAGQRSLERLRQHPHAPPWTHLIGDRLTADDLAAVQRFREVLAAAPAPTPAELFGRLSLVRDRVRLLRERLPAGLDLARDWASAPTTSREDLALRLDRMVPEDADLTRLIVYDTSGTTGHSLAVPTHPRTVAQAHVLLERALALHGVSLQLGPEVVACVNVCAQRSTWVFPSVFTVWGEAGFAKVNLNEGSWRGGLEEAREFLEDVDAQLMTGDPVSFAELLRVGVEVRPRAMVSTATTLEAGLKRALEERYRCPVLDWYSTTETGPIAVSHPDGEGYAIIAPDVVVEVLRSDGAQGAPGAPGEIVVSGGRNPYLPLLRYRTGDLASLVSVGSELRLVGLEGRVTACGRAPDGSPVNPLDVARALRLAGTFAQHQVVQRADGSCRAAVRPVPGVPVDVARLEQALGAIFGPAVEVVVDPALGSAGAKVVPFWSELP